jgi:DNA-binding response OmpR family regulator
MIAPEPAPAAVAARVLVVDGKPHLARGLTILLRAHGFVVGSTGTAAEALTVVADQPPDALLLDLALPDAEGTEVCRETRRSSNVPILLMSATGTGREQRRALNAGADDYLPMPFRAQDLLRRLNRLLAGSAGLAVSSRIEIGELVIDVVRRRVTRAGALLLLDKSRPAGRKHSRA